MPQGGKKKGCYSLIHSYSCKVFVNKQDFSINYNFKYNVIVLRCYNIKFIYTNSKYLIILNSSFGSIHNVTRTSTRNKSLNSS